MRITTTKAGATKKTETFILLEPGKSGELLVTFPADTSVFTTVACLIPGHYEAGMVGDLFCADARNWQPNLPVGRKVSVSESVALEVS